MSVVLAMPFGWFVMSQIAINHLRSGSLVSSKIVPNLIEEHLRQSPHLNVLRSENDNAIALAVGQNSPSRQRIARKWSTHVCSSGNAAIRSNRLSNFAEHERPPSMWKTYSLAAAPLPGTQPG